MNIVDDQPWPWSLQPVGFVNAALKALRELLTTGPVYVLIDPKFGEPDLVEADLDDEATATSVHEARLQYWQRPVHSIYTPKFQTVPPRRFPYLVRLEGADDERLRRSMLWAVQEHVRASAMGHGALLVAGWLQPFGRSSSSIRDVPPEEADPQGWDLARRLSTLMEARDGAGRIAPLRLTDRRMLQTLWGEPSLDWTLALTGIHSWAFMDRNLDVVAIRGIDSEHAARPLWSNKLNPAVLLRSSRLNRAVGLMLRELRRISDADICAVAVHIEAAVQLGLRDEGDIAAYASESALRPAFTSSPELPGLISRAASSSEGLDALIASERSKWSGVPAPPHSGSTR